MTADAIDVLLRVIGHALDELRALPCTCTVSPQGLMLCKRCAALRVVKGRGQ
jgi:hypothetical protein